MPDTNVLVKKKKFADMLLFWKYFICKLLKMADLLTLNLTHILTFLYKKYKQKLI